MDEKITAVVNIGQYAAIAIQPDEIFRYIQLGLAILCTLVLFAYRIWVWYKAAKADKKIDKEEFDELINIVKDTKDEIDNTINKDNNKNKEN